MNPPLTYLPAYLGLFAALLLALACNTFLDIEYGSFGFEVIFWAMVFGWTLLVGWRQKGERQESGTQKQKVVLLIGIVLSLLVFMPRWGFPRSGLYMLAALQASHNCVTTTRRQLHLGLLVSAVMVMFAASHYRADWTMLFYLIPYIIAVVFTLVSEQISRRAQSLRQASLGNPGRAGQGIAIAAATVIILGLGGILYLATPHVTWPYLQWRYGQLSNLGYLGGPQEQGSSGQSSERGDGNSAGGQAEEGEGGQGNEPSPQGGWPTPGQMREAAQRRGMPEWQSVAIMQMASLDEAIGEALAPIKKAIEDLWNQFKEWLKSNRVGVLASLFLALLLALLFVLAKLLKEAKAVTWLRTRYDFWLLAKLLRHQTGAVGALQFYRAIERLFVIHETPRPANANAREFLGLATYYRDDVRPELTELTTLFEQFRYDKNEPGGQQLARVRELYRAIFIKLKN